MCRLHMEVADDLTVRLRHEVAVDAPRLRALLDVDRRLAADVAAFFRDSGVEERAGSAVFGASWADLHRSSEARTFVQRKGFRQELASGFACKQVSNAPRGLQLGTQRTRATLGAKSGNLVPASPETRFHIAPRGPGSPRRARPRSVLFWRDLRDVDRIHGVVDR